MKKENIKETKNISYIKKIYNFLGVRRCVLILCVFIYMIKNAIKSKFFSYDDANSSGNIWSSPEPELPSRDPRMYKTQDQEDVLIVRARILFKIGMVLLMIFLTFRKINSDQEEKDKKNETKKNVQKKKMNLLEE